MRTWWGKRRRSERGATAVEYTLVAVTVWGSIFMSAHMLGFGLEDATLAPQCASGLHEDGTICK